jgi:TP901 family phage tail tape measure protein
MAIDLKINLNIDNFKAGAKVIEDSSKRFNKVTARINARFKETEEAFSGLAVKSGIAFAAIVGSVGLAIKSFADFETGLIGVGKTTNISGKELQGFGSEIDSLSKKIPVASSELLGIAQSAGQLGVTGSSNILKFTETIAKLGRASDLQGEAAATQLTRILTVTGDGVGTIDRFASVIVALGNNFAATESEIAEVATRLSQSTAVFNLGATNVAGISTALKALGVNAELGGSAVGRAFQGISKAIATGGSSLRELEQITGLAGDELKKTFEEDATKVFELFVQGLDKTVKGGANLGLTLQKVGLNGVGVNQVFGALVKGSSTLRDALKLANEEAISGTALNNEFNTAAKSLNNQFVQLQNTVISLARAVGAQFAPVVEAFLSVVTSLFKVLSESSFLSGLIVDFTALAVVVTGLISALSAGVLGFIAFSKASAAASAALRILGISARTAVGATGIGLILIVLGEVALNWETIFPKMVDIFSAFSLVIQRVSKFTGLALKAAFNLDFEAVKENVSKAKDVILTGFGDALAEIEAKRAEGNITFGPDPETEKQKLERLREITAEQRELASEDQKTFEQAQKEERDALFQEQLERDAEFKAQFESLDAASKLKLQEDLSKDLLTTEEKKRISLQKQIKDQIKSNIEAEKERERTRTVQGKIDAFFDSKKVKNTREILGTLSALQSSSSKELKAIGKAAAIASITFNTAQSASTIFQKVIETIPFPFSIPAAIAAAGAVTAFGVDQISQVLSAQKGGEITGPGIQGVDSPSILANLAPGELVVPKRNFDEVVNAVADQRNARNNILPAQTTGSEPATATIELSFKDGAIDFIEAQLIERNNLNISQEFF